MSHPTTPETEYLGQGYDYRGRFASYWHQIDEVQRALGDEASVLEIGPGNHMMTNYLRQRGCRVETVDVEAANRPDHLASVTALPLADRSFDVAVAFQVLEHLPFAELTTALDELARVSRRYVLFSVPDVRYYLELALTLLSPSHEWRTLVTLPRLLKRALPPVRPGGHHWEIGRAGYPLARVLAALPGALTLERAYRVPGNAIHHLFVCKTREP